MKCFFLTSVYIHTKCWNQLFFSHTHFFSPNFEPQIALLNHKRITRMISGMMLSIVRRSKHQHDVARGILKFQNKTWEFRATSCSVNSPSAYCKYIIWIYKKRCDTYSVKSNWFDLSSSDGWRYESSIVILTVPRRYFCCGSLLLLVLAVRVYTLVHLLHVRECHILVKFG